MNLSWKDLIGTVGMVITSAIGYLNYKGLNVPVISNCRWASALMLVIGLFTCALSGKVDGLSGNYLLIMNGLGGITMIAGILGVITGSKNYIVAMFYLIIGLWVITTAKHLFVK